MSAYDRRDRHMLLTIEPGQALSRKLVFDFRQSIDTAGQGNRIVKGVVLERIACDDFAWELFEAAGIVHIEIAHRSCDPVPVWWMRRHPFDPPLMVQAGEHVRVWLSAPLLQRAGAQNGLIVIGAGLSSIELDSTTYRVGGHVTR